MQNQYSIEHFLTIAAAHSPVSSPSGTRIAYLNNLTGVDQVYLLQISSGRVQQLTFAEEPVEFVAYSPVNEDEIVFGSSAGGNEKTQIYQLLISSRTLHALTDSPTTKYGWGGWSKDGRHIAFSSNERNGIDFDLYVMTLATAKTRLVFDIGGWCSSEGFSPSGRWLVAIKAQANTLYSLFLIDLFSDEEPKPLTAQADLALYHHICWLSDERGFYCISNLNSDKATLRFLAIDDKVITNKLELDDEIEWIALSRDESKIVVISNREGYSAVQAHSSIDFAPIGKPLLSFGVITGSDLASTGTELLFSYSDYCHSPTIGTWTIGANDHRDLVVNHCEVPHEIFVDPASMVYGSFDGLEVPVFVYSPKAQPPSTSAAIIHIHGGPEGQFRPNFAPLIQFFVYSGFVVIAPNVRGSAGYGKRYMALDDVEKRIDSVNDIAALHRFITDRHLADCNRVALYGGSYGGYMVLAGLAFHPELWAAGVDVVGISNLVTFLQNTSPYRRKLRESEYGSIERDSDLLWQLSPIRRVEDISAPLLIIHGANDPRVPLSEAELIHSRLTELGKTSELIVYGDEGHGLKKLKNRIDAYPKVVQFLRSALLPGKSI